MTFSLGWNKALGRGKALWLSWLKVNKLLAVLKYDIHGMSLEVVTWNYNEKVTVCFLLIVPVTWFLFSRVRFLISWGNDMLPFILQILKADFLHVSEGVSGSYPTEKSQKYCFFQELFWQFSAVSEELTQGTKFCQNSNVILETNKSLDHWVPATSVWPVWWLLCNMVAMF